eukprot:CAMPEP_0183296382 /NCGR_PEP_ID=MMETSP0160_2-20130417/3961_1 /TAXON_ID=2839 ORGANISM="Odontella Sinensis, Strain Grunow 1884" /NCGR_SAMPLE_ID=MMETSP0160_2 /ASSEMBLY_ACC=CAM_ASM_000250 /LENGTH=350 /DNA_ID=CAMNT_0025457989 /DNA_START=77 /DNA_END=1129 /DNA_ORIENTATION=-
MASASFQSDIGAVSESAFAVVSSIEAIISKDEGGRGMESLVVEGDLLQSAQLLSRLVPRRGDCLKAHVIILSGFPCCVDQDPPTETDGPPGALAIARAAIGLGYHATVVTDECNRSVFKAAMHNVGHWAESSLGLETFKTEEEMTLSDNDRLASLVEKCDLIIACERAGPAADGHCYTMRGIDMTERGLIAPLHRIVELGRGAEGIQFVAIGDGGNEMGMGKVLKAILTNPKIKNGDKIAAVTAADYLIAASVSNWGGYALAAAAAVVREDDIRNKRLPGPQRSLKDWVNRCVPSEEDEVSLLDRCVQAGCRDGVSGQKERTVDGMSLETSMKCLRSICSLALGSERDLA